MKLEEYAEAEGRKQSLRVWLDKTRVEGVTARQAVRDGRRAGYSWRVIGRWLTATTGRKVLHEALRTAMTEEDSAA